MSALQRQTYANATKPLFVTASGSSEIEGNLFIDGTLVTQGAVGTQGIRLRNSQYISFTDENTLGHNTIEGLRIYSAETGTPNVTFSELSVQPGSYLYFTQIGQQANSYIRPSATNAGQDILSIGGTIATKKLNLDTQSCGSGTIAIGATNVVIPSTLVTASSKVFLSFSGSPSAGPGNGPSQGNLIVNPSLIVPGVSFRVDLTDSLGVSTAASGVAVTFSWMIVN